MEIERQRAASEFAEQNAKMKLDQAAGWRSAMTEWDQFLDNQMSVAERETLLCINVEKQETKKLKSQFVQDKTDQKSKYDNASAELKKKKDEACLARKNARDNIRAKLEKERASMEQLMHECREWVGLRTGDTKLQALVGKSTPEIDAETHAITDLNHVAKRFEEAKKMLSVSITRMQNHPSCKLVGSYWIVALGLLLGIVSAGGAWLFVQAPLIVGLSGVVGAIFFTAIVHFAISPLAARTIRRTLPQVVDQEQQAYGILSQGRRIADQNCQQEIQRIEMQYLTNQASLDEDHRIKRTTLLNTFNSKRGALKKASSERRIAIAGNRSEKFHRINSDRKPKLEELQKSQSQSREDAEQSHHTLLRDIESKFHYAQQRIVRRWQDGCKNSTDMMRRVAERSSQSMPLWNSEEFNSGQWPRLSDSLAWRVGEIMPLAHLQQEMQSLSLPMQSPDQPWQVLFDVVTHGTLTLETDAACKETSDKIVRNTLLRAVTSVPAGSLNITIIDPEGLGKEFSWLMSLADIDPAMVNHRVWTQPLHIAEQLSVAARHVEDVIQQSLRNRYANVLEYNRDAGPMAIPYRLIVWSNFPFGLDDNSWQSLCSIMSSGGRCGVGVILQVSGTHVWPTFADRTKLNEFGLRLKLNPVEIPASEVSNARTVARVTIDQPELVDCPLTPEMPPDDNRLQMIMEHHLKAASEVGKCIVPFESIALPAPEQQIASSADGLAIPLGISDAGRIQSMKLGAGTAQHVLIAGKTGSGKSSMLHTMITSAAMKYGPDQLRLVLLDFKKGVEFQIYSEVALSHADIIGIESKREFGVSTLEYVDRVLHARGRSLSAMGCSGYTKLDKEVPAACNATHLDRHRRVSGTVCRR